MAEPVTVGTAAKAVLKYAPQALSILGAIFGGGGSKGSSEAVAMQAKLNEALLKIFQQQQATEGPYRKAILEKLFQRTEKKFPGINLPTGAGGKPLTPLFNPMAQNRRPTGSFLTPTPSQNK